MPDAPPGPDIGADPQITLVDRVDAVAPALTQVDAGVIGVDVERADSDNYFRRAALVQVGVEDHCVLVDTVALDDLTDLDAFLSERLVVLHALDNDVEPLASAGVAPGRLADTAIAAALLGLPTGLGPLLAAVLGVELSGDKETFQRADWAARPLPDEMAAYAAGDVVHLPALWAELAARLDDAGRTRWYEQELAEVVARATVERRDWTRVKGATRLSAGQRAVLRSVWEERERIAREHDLAPNRLLRDEVLRDIAVTPPIDERALVRRSQRRRRLVRTHAPALLAAVRRGLDAPPEVRDDNGRRMRESDRVAHDRLRRARAEVAAELGIDAGVLCPGRPLLRAIAADPADGQQLCELAGLRPWQVELLAEPLWDAYEAALSETAAEA